MPTLVNDPQPVELTALIERRRQLGQVHWLGLSGREYSSIDASGLIELGPDELAARIDWP